MDNAVYVSLSRQVSLQQAMDITANNLANLDTAGFKVESMVVQTDPIAPSPTASLAANDNPAIQYVLNAAVARNFAQGPLQQTGNPYDLAIQGDAFFSVQTAAGTQYTRDGRFMVSPTGQLVDQQGEPVLDSADRPITFQPKGSPPIIGADGTITQDGVPLGKIGVFRFPSKAPLSKVGGNNFANTNPANAPIIATDASVKQGMIEQSNVQPVAEITNLISISRAYERITQMMNSTTDLSKTAIDRLGKSS